MSPNPGRCETLALDLIKKFEPEEADHDAVCFTIKPRSQEAYKFNLEKCKDEPRLAPPSPHATHATVGHTHVNQTLKNIISRALVTVPALFKFADKDRRFDSSVIFAQNHLLAETCARGLAWEVLDYRMEEEEPHAAILIQTILNNKHHTGAVAHEMQVVARITEVVLLKEAQLFNGKLQADVVRQKMAELGLGHVEQV